MGTWTHAPSGPGESWTGQLVTKGVHGVHGPGEFWIGQLVTEGSHGPGEFWIGQLTMVAHEPGDFVSNLGGPLGRSMGSNLATSKRSRTLCSSKPQAGCLGCVLLS